MNKSDFVSLLERHFFTMLEMVRTAIHECPEQVFTGDDIRAREHLYHALVWMDMALSDNPPDYDKAQIVSTAAASLQGVASKEITRDYLIAFLDRVESHIHDYLSDDSAYLNECTVRGRVFTWMDRVLLQLRHMQHHMGAIDELLRQQSLPTLKWIGFEGK